MRIISGIYKGRVLTGHDINGTRPTMDRVRESLFAMIQSKLTNSIVLDLFAGSGSLGFESLSNGSKHCYFNDINKKCVKVIEENANKLKCDDYTVLNKDYKKALIELTDISIKFDIIFLDPPYGLHINSEIIKYIVENNLLKEKGIIVCEIDEYYLDDVTLSVYKRKKYGDKEIIIYEKN